MKNWAKHYILFWAHIFAQFFNTGKWRALMCQRVSSNAGQAVDSLVHRCQTNKIILLWLPRVAQGLQVTRHLAKRRKTYTNEQMLIVYENLPEMSNWSFWIGLCEWAILLLKFMVRDIFALFFVIITHRNSVYQLKQHY